jgi:hypothetical protein
MVNGRQITGRFSVGLPKHEIRRPFGSGRLDNELEPIPINCADISLESNKRVVLQAMWRTGPVTTSYFGRK